MSDPIRVMICDDSAVMRRLIKTALKIDPELEVICEANHEQDALGKMFDHRPDLLVMDVEMPIMDGIEAVKEIRKRSTTLPIIMFSSLTSRGAELTLDAIEVGASDFSCKPANAGRIEFALEQVRKDLIPKIYQWVRRKSKTANAGLQASRLSLPPAEGKHAAAPASELAPEKTDAAPLAARSNAPSLGANHKPAANRPPQLRKPIGKPATTTPALASNTTGGARMGKQSAGVSLAGSVAVVAVAVSTGGPQALAELIKALPTDLNVPLLIAPHMPAVFTGMLAERLAAHKGHRVREAKTGEEMCAGDILIAPGDYHMVAVRDNKRCLVHLNQDPPENSCRPAADPLFRSVAKTFGKQALGVVLTGMGKDGTRGAEMLKKSGASIIAQDEESCVVWGIPGSIVEAGLADIVLPLDQIAAAIVRATERKLAPF